MQLWDWLRKDKMQNYREIRLFEILIELTGNAMLHPMSEEQTNFLKQEYEYAQVLLEELKHPKTLE